MLRGWIPKVLVGISCLWFGLVFAYWRALVPLAPVTEVELGRRVVAFGPAEDGQLLLATPDMAERKPPKGHFTGPFDAFDPRVGLITRLPLQVSDNLLAVESRHAAVLRDGVLHVIDLGAGNVVTTIAASGLVDSAVFATDKVLLTGTSTGAVAYDALTGRQLWHREGAYPDQSLTLSAGVALAVVTSMNQSSNDASHSAAASLPPEFQRRPTRMLLIASTGEPDLRFGESATAVGIEVSPDETLMMIETDPAIAVTDIRDLKTGRLLWNLPFPSDSLQFSPDRNEIWRLETSTSGPAMKISAWNARTGDVVAEPYRSGTESWTSYRGLFVRSHDGTYVVRRIQRNPPSWLLEAMRKLKLPTQFLVSRSLPAVVDSQSNAVVGLLPAEFGRAIRDLDGRGFTMVSEDRLAHFVFPPAWDWGWLFSRGLIPPFLAWLLWYVIHDWRRWHAHSLRTATIRLRNSSDDPQSNER